MMEQGEKYTGKNPNENEGLPRLDIKNAETLLTSFKKETRNRKREH